jgi:hypothetical protein
VASAGAGRTSKGDAVYRFADGTNPSQQGFHAFAPRDFIIRSEDKTSSSAARTRQRRQRRRRRAK